MTTSVQPIESHTAAAPGPLFFVSLGMISAAALSFEILLMRVLTIVQWHHFAYMIISLALLGYGASGSFLTLAYRWLSGQLATAYFVNASGFALSSFGCFLVVQRLPFNPLEMLWDPYQPLYLLTIYLLLALPFFFAANCVGIAFRRFPGLIHRVYAADLLGAGTGALGIVILLTLLSPNESLRVLVLLGCASAALFATDKTLPLPRIAIGVVLASGVVLATSVPTQWSEPRMSPYKGLSQTLAVMGSELINERDGPMARLSVVRNEKIPFRSAAGLSLNSRAEPPAQLGVFSDGDGMSAITRFDGKTESLAYLADVSSALPYSLLDRPRVLIVGAGGGSDVLQAIFFHAAHIDAVEVNPQMATLVRDEYGDFSGHLFTRNDVTVHIDDARHFVAGSKQHYDLLQFALVDSFAASSAGIQALNETYLYTTEALGEYIQHLSPSGLIAITRWLQLPPRDSLKLFATALAALEELGVAQPERHLALIRSWKTTTLLVRATPLSQRDVQRIRDFCRVRSFDLVYIPGIVASDANQYNLLAEPVFFESAMALIGTHRADFMARYKFNITPATDDKPYFFHFFKWDVLPELLTLQQHGGLPLMEWGYIVLIATLLQAVAASALVILLPLIALRATRSTHRSKRRVAVYFSALGLAYLFIEIAFIQKFVLFLGHPVYAVAAVICGFLLFSGTGSAFSARFAQWLENRGQRPSHVASLLVAITLALYLLFLSTLLQKFLGLPDPVKFLVVVVLIAPLAFAMGMPFALGLRELVARAPALVPWAWGINGSASVISAVLATLLAVHIGFTWVGIGAALLYVVASRVKWADD